jgi:acylphosphatase
MAQSPGLGFSFDPTDVDKEEIAPLTPSTSTPTAKHCFISGWVQGVGYRYYVKRKADELRISGFVRNLPDRSVEVWIQGQEKDLAEMLSFLQVGPLWARVDRVEENTVEPKDQFTHFYIQG